MNKKDKHKTSQIVSYRIQEGPCLWKIVCDSCWTRITKQIIGDEAALCFLLPPIWQLVSPLVTSQLAGQPVSWPAQNHLLGHHASDHCSECVLQRKVRLVFVWNKWESTEAANTCSVYHTFFILSIVLWSGVKVLLCPALLRYCIYFNKRMIYIVVSLWKASQLRN